MADFKKISELSAAGPFQDGDGFEIRRGSSNLRMERPAVIDLIRTIMASGVTKPGDNLLDAADMTKFLRLDASGGAFSQALPDAATSGQYVLAFKADVSANAITITAEDTTPIVTLAAEYDMALIRRISGGWEVAHRWLRSVIEELARDAVGAALTPAAGVTITPDDGGDTITVGAKSYVLAAGAGSSVTGTTAETALATVAIPGGAMGANGRLRITTLWKYANSGNTKTLRIRLGGISGTGFMGINVTSTVLHQAQHIIRNHGAQNSQVAFNAAAANFDGSVANAETTGTVDTTTAKDLVFSVQLASGSDSAELLDYMVELIRP